MLQEKDARELVDEFLAKHWARIKGGLVVYPPSEKPYGWIFMYSSRLYDETGDINYMLAGNGPIVVERVTGKLHTLGTAKHPTDSIADFEREHGFSS